MDFWLLYLMTRTEDIKSALTPLTILGFIFGLVGIAVTTAVSGDKYISAEAKAACGQFKGYAKTLLYASILCGLLALLLPTRKDWYLMIGGYYVSHIEGVDKLPANVVGAANEFLERYREKEEPRSKKQGGGA